MHARENSREIAVWRAHVLGGIRKSNCAVESDGEGDDVCFGAWVLMYEVVLFGRGLGGSKTWAENEIR